MTSRQKRLGLYLLLLLLAVLLAAYHQVPKQITPQDHGPLNGYYALAGLRPDSVRLLQPFSAFDRELQTIRRLQQAVQQRNPPGRRGIPQGESRQPQDVYASEIGECYDRAYTLAKLYRYGGWSTRQVALYRNDPDRSDLGELLTAGIQSHASLEVRTSKGWLIVDPDRPFIGLASDSLPHGYFEVPLASPLTWQDSIPDNLHWQLLEDPLQVYGLYSRHGRFFPPYNFIPDVHWGEVWGNF